MIKIIWKSIIYKKERNLNSWIVLFEFYRWILCATRSVSCCCCCSVHFIFSSLVLYLQKAGFWSCRNTRANKSHAQVLSSDVVRFSVSVLLVGKAQYIDRSIHRFTRYLLFSDKHFTSGNVSLRFKIEKMRQPRQSVPIMILSGNTGLEHFVFDRHDTIQEKPTIVVKYCVRVSWLSNHYNRLEKR